MNIIYFVEITESKDADISALTCFVCKEKQKRLDKYHFEIDRRLSLYADLLVRMQIMHYLGLNNDEIQFGITEYGKPFLQNYYQFHFNISHTRNALVVALSDTEVGVDIEKTNSVDYNIVERFFTPPEQSYVYMHDNQRFAFYDIWTRKEAYIKCIGTGLNTPLCSFDVFCLQDFNSIYTYRINNYIISVCYKGNISNPPHFTILSENEIKDRWLNYDLGL